MSSWWPLLPSLLLLEKGSAWFLWGLDGPPGDSRATAAMIPSLSGNGKDGSCSPAHLESVRFKEIWSQRRWAIFKRREQAKIATLKATNEWGPFSYPWKNSPLSLIFDIFAKLCFLWQEFRSCFPLLSSAIFLFSPLNVLVLPTSPGLSRVVLLMEVYFYFYFETRL